MLHMLELNQAMISSSEGFHPEQTVFLLKPAEKRLTEFLDKPYLNGLKIDWKRLGYLLKLPIIRILYSNSPLYGSTKTEQEFPEKKNLLGRRFQTYRR